jgi:hypothetical protein
MRKEAISVVDMSTKTDPASQSLAGNCSPTLTSFDSATGFFTFSTHCGTSLNNWDQQVQLVDWATIVTEEILAENQEWDQIKAVVPDILNSKAQVHCSCPAFQYWGHQYNLTNDDSSALQPNAIPPSAVNNRGELSRDPDERHSCKHLVSVYNTFFR